MNIKATVLSEQVDPLTDSAPDQRSVLENEEKPCTELVEDMLEDYEESGTELEEDTRRVHDLNKTRSI